MFGAAAAISLSGMAIGVSGESTGAIHAPTRVLASA